MSPFVHLYRTPPIKTPAAARTAPLAKPGAAPASWEGATAPLDPRAREAGPLEPTPTPSPTPADLAPAFTLMRVMVERTGRERREQIAELTDRRARCSSPRERQVIDHRIGALQDRQQALDALAAAVKRAAANPATTPAEAERLQQLVLEGTGSCSAETLWKIALVAEDLARNVGRTPRSDRGLFHETAGVLQRQGQIRDGMRALEAEFAETRDRGRQEAILRELADLARAAAACERAKAALDRLSEDPAVTRETVAEACALARELQAPHATRQLEALAERIERLAGIARETPVGHVPVLRVRKALPGREAAL